MGQQNHICQWIKEYKFFHRPKQKIPNPNSTRYCIGDHDEILLTYQDRTERCLNMEVFMIILQQLSCQ